MFPEKEIWENLLCKQNAVTVLTYQTHLYVSTLRRLIRSTASVQGTSPSLYDMRLEWYTDHLRKHILVRSTEEYSASDMRFHANILMQLN